MSSWVRPVCGTLRRLGLIAGVVIGVVAALLAPAVAMHAAAVWAGSTVPGSMVGSGTAGSVLGSVVPGSTAPGSTAPGSTAPASSVIGASAGADPPVALGDVASFRWPLAGTPTVLRPFEPPPKPWLPGHRGVDLAAAAGAPVYAAGPGTVSFAGKVAGVPVVSITHAGGLRTTYEPVVATVRAGDRVAAGTPIGAVSTWPSHCPSGTSCLHWGLIRGQEYLDPLSLIGRGQVRLFPS
ncbi:MAG TPA: peptidoglycan DD-metalloendopeptidase family protein [Micromonosporaceae bacterium]|jgi:murein DD-endopeptidase MepM/ murein hydrolase activator NlpD|nr:peptidoglycan DD-metalloendopeptidase family protein [Micromonosporaceae bacterium]